MRKILSVVTLFVAHSLLSLAQVSSVSPAQNALNVQPNTAIQITFNTAMSTSSFNDTTSFLVYGRMSGRYRGTFAFTSGNTVVTFTPDSIFKKDEVVTVDLTHKIRTAAGDSLAPLVWQFSVVVNPSKGTFQPKVDYATGMSPSSVFVSDLDGDGDGDLAVANVFENTVSILRNNGDGTFQPKVDYATGGYSNSVFVSDVDGDSDGDVVVANSIYGTGNTVSVLKNNGDGTFAAKMDYTTGSAPYSAFVSDVDGDGDGDIVVANSGSSAVSILKNNGDGTFETKVDYPTGSTPLSVFVSDVDGDGDGDIVTANRVPPSVSVLKNNGDGTFAAKVDYPTGSQLYSVFVSDVDGDGDGDIVVADRGSNAILVFKNNGVGTFAANVSYATGDGAESVFVSDVDGDGDGDIMTANSNSSTVSVFKNNGDGTFAAKVDYPTGNNPPSVFVSDVDGDGAGDIVTANYGSSTVSVLKNIVNDVSVVSNVPAFGAVLSSTTVPLSSIVKNFSPASKTFPILAEVDTTTGNFSTPLFSNTQNPTINGYDSAVVNFASWTASSNGQYKLRVITQLAEDEVRSNDTLITTFTVLVPTQPLLVVYESEAQGGTAEKSALTNKGYQYDQYQRLADINFSLSNWQRVVFVAGQDSVLSNTDADSLIAFLNAPSTGSGRRLLLLGNALASSQQADDASTSRAILIRQKLGVNWVSNFTSSTTVNGITGDSVGNGISLTLGVGSGNKERTTRAGNFRVLDSILTYSSGIPINAGWRRDDGNYKIVYAGIPFHNASTSAMREQFIDQAMQWLTSGNYIIPKVVSITPAQNALAVSPTTTIQVTFSRAMNTSTFNDTASFIVSGMVSGRHRGTFTFSPSSVILNPVVSLSEVEGRRDEKSQRLGKEILRYAQNDNIVLKNETVVNNVVTFTPTLPFKPGEIVTVVLTSGIKDPNNIFISSLISQFTVASTASTGIFGTNVDYATGGNPYSVCVSDLDNDGDGDLAVANNISNTVSILKNNGDGTFLPKVDYTTGSYPSSVFVSDVDGDGDGDLAVANNGASSTIVSIFKNNGDGTFQPKTDYTTGTSPASVFVSDLDGDGDGDVVAANTYSSTVSILKNNGDGTFQPKVDYATGNSPRSVFVSDVDGDGDGDLAVANNGASSTTVSIFKNNGDGTFQPKTDYTTGTSPASVFVSDLDGDGDDDLAAANASGTVSILKNNGDGTFQPKTDYITRTSPTSVFVSDLDGDGDGDLVVANVSSTTVSIFKNNGDGTFQPKVDYATGAIAYSVFVSDVEGDGDGDLAVANYGSNTVSILKNLVSGAEIRGQKFLDLDGDGIKDIGEPGLSNWEIRLSGTVSDTAFTDGSGNYSLTNLPPGSYSVSEVLQNGWSQTYPAGGTHSVTITADEIVTGKDFGNFRNAQIRGKKYNDDERDSLISGDPTLNGWVMKLYRSGVFQSRTITSGSGDYSFTVSQGGTYTVEESLQVGWIQTFPRLSAPGVVTITFGTNAGRRAYQVTISSGDSITGKDFGNFFSSYITVKKREDYDGNFATTTDRRAKKWNLRLYRDSISVGTLIRSVNSDSELTVIELIPDTYIAVEADSSGWPHIGKVINGTPQAGSFNADTVTLSSGQFRTVEFVNFHPRIVIRKYVDADGNFGTSGDRSPKRWNLALYINSILPGNLIAQVSSAESLEVFNPPTGTYIALEADSTGWIHIGKIHNGASVAGSVKADTFTYTSGQLYRTDFLNFNPNIFVVRKLQDQDGIFSTSGDRTFKKWNLALYRSSISPGNLVQQVLSAESLVVSNLGNGTYIAVETDSANWYHIGKKRNGTSFQGSYSADTVVLTGGQRNTIDFVNTRPTITIRKFRDSDGVFETSGDRTPKRWSLILYRRFIQPDSIKGTVSSSESLVIHNLPPDDYIAREADSSGWSHIGTILDGSGAASNENQVQFTISSTESHVIDFINSSLSGITVTKFLDQDGDFRTPEGSLKAWGLKLYRISGTDTTLIDSVASAPVLSQPNLPEGLYMAMEADSGYPWSHIGTELYTNSILENRIGGTHNKITFTLSQGQSRHARFINFNRNRIKVWTAAQNCSWDNGYNWDPPGVPIPGDSIIVPDTAKCELLIPPCASLGTIQIASTETVRVQAGETFSVAGDVIISGTMIADSSDTSTINVCGNLILSGGFYAGKSTIVFVGINTQTINAEGKKFFRVKVGGTECPGCGGGVLFATSAHGQRGDTRPIPTGRDGLAKGGREGLENSHPPQARVKTEGSFTVSEALIMDADLDAVGDTVFVTNSDPHAVTGSGILTRGTMRRAIRQQTTQPYRFESPNTFLQFDTTGTYPSTMTMTTYPDSFPANLDTSTTVRRFYDINPSGGSRYKARVSLRFDPLELRTIPRDSLRLYRSTNNGTSWDSIGGVLDSVNNAMIVDSITEFSKWTFGHRPRATGVTDEHASIPNQFSLSQNYPNPFNPLTEIQYSVPSRQYVSLKIYDILGREVATLVNEKKEPGEYSVTWDAGDRPRQTAGGLASGIYIYRLIATPQSGNQLTVTMVRKMLLIR